MNNASNDADRYFAGTAARAEVEWRGDRPRISSPSYSLPVCAEACRLAGLTDGSRAAVVVRPEWLGVESQECPAGRRSDHAEVAAGTLVEDIYLGSNRKLVIDLPGGLQAVARFSAGRSVPAGLVPGTQVSAYWPVERGVVVADDHVDRAAAVETSTPAEKGASR